MPYAKMRDGTTEIYYRIRGEGFPVVLIHGYQWSADMWMHQENVFAKKYKVIAYDLRGLGRSDKPQADIYPNTLHAQDLDDLMTELKIKKFAIVGCSMGGMIAQQYALDHPEKLAAIVLFATSAAGKPFIPSNIDDMRQSLLKTAAGRAEMCIKVCFTDRFLKYSPDVDAILAMQEELAGINSDPKVLYANFRSFWEFDLRDQISKIKVPTLIVVGDQDMPTPVTAAEYLRDHISGSRLVVLSGGHHLNLENSIGFNETVLEFLEEHIK